MTTQIQAVCCNCKASSPVTIYNSINVEHNPELKDAVKNGSAFTWTCPQCGKLNLVAYPTLYHDPVQKLMVLLSGGEQTPTAKLDSYFSEAEELKGYTARMVDSAGALIEKVKIFDAGLDDVAMEICKLVTCAEMGKAVDLKFLKMDGADNEITLSYPENGQMQMVAIGFNVYEDARGIVSRNPVLQNPGSGFVKVDNDWISTIIG